ncbi:MAG: hypothetical protein ABI416_18310 [Ginsengibacter sp.]
MDKKMRPVIFLSMMLSILSGCVKAQGTQVSYFFHIDKRLFRMNTDGMSTTHALTGFFDKRVINPFEKFTFVANKKAYWTVCFLSHNSKYEKATIVLNSNIFLTHACRAFDRNGFTNYNRWIFIDKPTATGNCRSKKKYPVADNTGAQKFFLIKPMTSGMTVKRNMIRSFALHIMQQSYLVPGQTVIKGLSLVALLQQLFRRPG